MPKNVIDTILDKVSRQALSLDTFSYLGKELTSQLLKEKSTPR